MKRIDHLRLEPKSSSRLSRPLGLTPELVAAAATVCLLVWVAPALQAIGFAAYFVGWSFIGMIQPEASPGTYSAYTVIAAAFIALTAAQNLAQNAAPRPVTKVISELFACIALIGSLAVPPTIGYVRAALGTSFLTADLPREAGDKSLAHGRGIIVSYGRGEDGRYTLLPLDLAKRSVDASTIWFANEGATTVEEIETGRLHPQLAH